jgi:hypothetical protein
MAGKTRRKKTCRDTLTNLGREHSDQSGRKRNRVTDYSMFLKPKISHDPKFHQLHSVY